MHDTLDPVSFRAVRRMAYLRDFPRAYRLSQVARSHQRLRKGRQNKGNMYRVQLRLCVPFLALLACFPCRLGGKVREVQVSGSGQGSRTLRRVHRSSVYLPRTCRPQPRLNFFLGPSDYNDYEHIPILRLRPAILAR